MTLRQLNSFFYSANLIKIFLKLKLYLFHRPQYNTFINIYKFEVNFKNIQSMEQQKEDYLFSLFERLSVKLNKPLNQMKQFYHILKDNWYDSKQALCQLTDDKYNEMKIPRRLVDAIKQQIGAQENQKKFETSNNQSDKNNQKKQKKTIQLNQFQMTEYTNQLQNHLKNQYKHQINQVVEIFETLYKIIHNIISDPYEIKFRTLKKSNNMVQRIIIKNQAVSKYLMLFGFQEDGQKYYLHAPKTYQLIFVQEVIQEKADKLKIQNVSPFLGDVKMPQKPTEQSEINQKMYVQKFGKLQDQFNQQKLSDMKYVDALEKLIKFRHQIMSKPPSDRRLRIYHKRFETKQLNYSPQVDIAQEFQKSEDKLIQSYWAQMINQNRKKSNFQSKRKQEFDFLIKQKIHKQTTIKIKLPNDIIIEAKFGPLEKLKEVAKVVSNVIIGEFYFFQAPPLKKFDKEMEKTLYELQSVPMGSFYLGLTGDWYIAKEYGEKIQK